MRTIALPYSGELLLAHLISYGLLVALDNAGVAAYLHHPRESLSFTPSIDVGDDVDDETIAAAVRATAATAEEVVEADLVAGETGIDRRSVIWARGTMKNDTSRAGPVVARRGELVGRAAGIGDRALLGVLAGLGAPASWGPDFVKPSHGATALDGVCGNNTSDIVRGVLRPGRSAAAGLEGAELWATLQGRGKSQLDKSGWAPLRTPAPLAHQWIAVLGLGLFPVAHRPAERSVTPACWPKGKGVTVPLFSRPSTLARARATVGLRSLVSMAAKPGEDGAIVAAAELRAMGILEIVTFEQVIARGQGSSVAFSFRRGQRIAL